MARLRLGELLVSSNILTTEQLEEALRMQGETRRRLGDVLVQLGYVDETRLTQALSQQLAVPWVSLYHVDFSRQLLNLVPREVAERYCIVPIFVRRVRKVDTLYIGMDDPTNEAAIAEVSQFSGLPVKPMISSPSDIRNAIRVYYGGETLDAPPTQSGQTAADSPQAMRKPPVPRQTLPDTAAARKAALEAIELVKQHQQEARKKVESIPDSEIESEPPPSRDSPTEDPEIEASVISVPKPKKGARAKMISLTLLDGTSIQLPARPGGAKPGSEESLTARDLVSALRAVSHGADASEILGENPKWEALFAALLSVLLRKGLIADWEFIEELRKV